MIDCWLECGQPLDVDEAVWIVPGGTPAARVNEDGVRILDDEQEVPADTAGAVPLHRDCWHAWQTPPELTER
jgi:hypothetical protein